MLQYIVRRMMLSIVTLFAISAVCFVIILLPPGDYITYYVSQQTATGNVVSSDQADLLRERYGLNQPIAIQYFKWISMFVRGDFGMSMTWQRPVADLIWSRMALTVVLSLTSVIVTWAIALPIGIYSAVRQYSIGDYVFTMIGFFGIAVPNFLLALTLMYIGFAHFGTNVGGLFSPEYIEAPWSLARTWDLLKHLPLPATILALSGTAQVIRVMRANLLDELRKPYVIAARARGLSEWRAILTHPVRVALNPFISTIGYLFPYIVSGSIIVSLVLGLPTVGPLLLTALLAQDMFLAGAIIMLLGALTVLGTLISDLLLMWIDPRIREMG